VTFWALTALINCITSFLLGLIVYSRNSKSVINITYGLFCLAGVVWSFSYFIWQISNNEKDALFWCRALMAGAIFIPVCYLHHIFSLLHLLRNKRIFLIISYSICFLAFAINFTPFFVSGVSKKLYFNYWPNPGIAFKFFLPVWIYFVIYSVFIILSYLKQSSGVLRSQLRYVLIGTIVGWSGGITNFPLWFNLNFPPVGNILMSMYFAIVAYAIAKYRLMDIRVAFTRIGIFLTVYTLVLGIPFWIGFKLLGQGLWLTPVALMGFFATVGPFIYLFLQKRAEDQLLQEQRRYQMTLRQASAGMSRIKDLKKLLNLIVYIVTRAVRLDHALVYMHDQPRNQFILGAHKRRNGHITFIKTIPDDSPLITYLVETGAPIVYEEIKQRVQDYADQDLAAVEKIVVALEGDLVLPILIEKRLLAIIILGKKESGKLYTEDDLSVFSILANQTALAIENAQFYEEMKITQEQLFQAEKMATIGTMADGLSHQINNRFHALGFIAGDALDSLKLSKNMEGSDKVKELLTDLERAFNRVQENVVQGGEVVQGLLKYTRKGEAGFAAIDFNQAFKSAFEMAQFKIKVQELKVVHAYDPQNIPKIKGNFTQLQEVFFNLIDNAYDAMMQRKIEKAEPQYQPTLTVHVAREDDCVEIVFEDNGMGVKKEDVHKLFTPFFTTKLSSKKGTGLGLYVIKKIIEGNHKGKVEMLSDYMAGTRMKLRLPIAVE